MTALVGVVVIGRNEGERLERCIREARKQCAHVIYVDSDSSDGSTEKAEALGAEVIRLEVGPFTAARGRQVGFERLCERLGDVQFVQFIDGDCILSDGWLARAQAVMEQDEKLGGVVGLRREEAPEVTLFNRLVDLDWRMPIGETDSLGSGDAFLRASALANVGGWRSSLIAGEDPELAFRLVDAGWRIVRLDETMTSHDVNMTTWRQFWRRAVRAGHAYAEVGFLRRKGAGRRWQKRVWNIVLLGGITPLALIAGWLISPWISVIAAAVYLVSAARITRWRLGLGDPIGFALVYTAATISCKLANFIGIMKYAISRLRRRPAELIEYKSVASESGASA